MRRLPLLLGLLILAAAWFGPLPGLAPQAFAAHMSMHLGVVAAAAPLFALGLGGSRWDPARALPWLFAPIPASILELVVVWGWHAPQLHHAAGSDPRMLALEQGMFLAVGLLLWLSAFGGADARGRRAAGIGGLLLTSMHMTLLGALLALSPRVLYPHTDGALGLTALEDQHLGGVLMLLAGGSAYLAGGLYLLLGLLREGAARTAGEES